MSAPVTDPDPSGILALAEALEKDARPWSIVHGAAYHLREQRAEIERFRVENAQLRKYLEDMVDLAARYRDDAR